MSHHIVINGESYPNIQINGQRITGPCENWEKFNRNPDSIQKEVFIQI